jgi:hypothetical protein
MVTADMGKKGLTGRIPPSPSSILMIGTIFSLGYRCCLLSRYGRPGYIDI